MKRKIILNTKNIKDYKFNLYRKIIEIERKYKNPIENIITSDSSVEEISKGYSRIGNIPYTLVKISPDPESESINFVPFCCVLSYFLPPTNKLGDMPSEEYFCFIPKQRNSVINGKPIIEYDKNIEVREEVLCEYFPEILDKIDFLIGKYDFIEHTKHDYCLMLDEAFNMITESTSGIPLPEPDLDFLINHVPKLF